MKLSTRNMLKGKVSSITLGAVNAEVLVELAPGVIVASIITKNSCEKLGLKEGKEAFVAIKASDVIIGIDD